MEEGGCSEKDDGIQGQVSSWRREELRASFTSRDTRDRKEVSPREREREREAGMFLVPGTENGWLEGGWNGWKRGRKKGIGATGVGLHSAR